MPLSKDIIRKTLATPKGERAYKIVETLCDAGYDAWWVGGSVRDMLMGLLPNDIDIATSAKPEEIEKLFHRAHDPSWALGSTRVELGNDTFEVTTFRKEDPTSDGRRPAKVIFGTREEDAERRDFTVNAIYWHPISEELFDPFDGEGDIHERLIRFIGDPATRIHHDALRLLRAVRFRAVLAGQYHPDTYQALQDLAKNVLILSGSRQREELEKMLMGTKPDRALEDLWELGILKHFLPELHICKGIPQPADYHHEGDVWEHTLQCLRSFRPEDGIDTRIAALFHDCGKADTFSLKERIRFDHHATISADKVTKVLERLQCPTDRRKKIDWLVRHHMSMTFLEMNDERKAHWYFHPWFRELLQVFYLDIAGTTPANFDLYERIVKDYEHFLDAHPRPEKPLLDGKEVMDLLDLSPGEEVGKLLSLLHNAQIRGDIRDKDEAKKFLLSHRTP